MGCCTPKPRREEELIKYFWASLPIRRMTIKHFKNCLRQYKRGETKEEDIKNFKEFFLNETYLLHEVDHLEPVSNKIFEIECQKEHFNHFLLCISLLAQWWKDAKREDANMRYLLRVDEYLKLGIFKFHEPTKEWYIPLNDLIIVFKRFIEMTTLNSVEPVLNESDIDEAETMTELLDRYDDNKIDFIIREKLAGRTERVTLRSFVQNDLDWLTRDDSSRQTLLARDIHAKTIVNKTTTVSTTVIENTNRINRTNISNSNVNSSSVSQKSLQQGSTVSQKSLQQGSTVNRTYEQQGGTVNRTYEQQGSTVNRTYEQQGSTVNRTYEQQGSTVNRIYEQQGSTVNRTYLAQPSTATTTVNKSYNEQQNTSGSNTGYSKSYETQGNTYTTKSYEEAKLNSNNNTVYLKEPYSGSTVSTTVRVDSGSNYFYEDKPDVVKKSVVRTVREQPKEQVENNSSTTSTTYGYSNGFGNVLRTVHDRHAGEEGK
jgi:hypothetical protein